MGPNEARATRKMTDLSPARMSELRQRIEAELVELSRSSGSGAGDRAPVKLDRQSRGRLSRADAMRAQAMAVASDRRRAARIAALKTALGRIESGNHGDIAACDEPIAFGRIEVDRAMPACVACASTRGR
jgi:DnaK suppressor protein